MLDRYDAVIYHPKRRHAYFFRGEHYLKYKPGSGVVPTSAGTVLRTIGVTGWTSFPTSFRSNLDAGMLYSNGFLYFFKGKRYIKYEPGKGVVKTPSGSVTRTIGVTGWKSLPTSFRSDLDAVFFYGSNGHAYFFKGDKYVKYKPGSGVVPTGSNEVIRTIGTTGWRSLPAHFHVGLDAVFDYPRTRRTYFFKDREYVRFRPGKGVDPRYPRRIGLHHRKHGGWPGLSSMVAAPTTVEVEASRAVVWLWIAGEVGTADLDVRLNGQTLPSPSFGSPALGTAGADVVTAVGSVARGSSVRLLTLGSLTPDRPYQVDVYRKGIRGVIESVSFRTAPTSMRTGQFRFVLGSCSNTTLKPDVDCYDAIVSKNPRFALFAGDNCYYYSNDLKSTSGSKNGDWRSLPRMITRQLEARNHPQFVPLVRGIPVFGTWDDHDCGYNNVDGANAKYSWVGRSRAAGVFRALWSHAYRHTNDLYYDFAWGPVHFFATDGRYFKNTSAQRLLGAGQLDTLVSDLKASKRPLKVVLFANVALHTGHQEGLRKEANPEYQELIQAMSDDVLGRILVLSGDVHYSECNYAGASARAVKVLEVTSSPLRIKKKKAKSDTHAAGDSRRLWQTRDQSFALIDVDIQSSRGQQVTSGSVTIQAIDANGQVLGNQHQAGALCETVWNLATGAVT